MDDPGVDGLLRLVDDPDSIEMSIYDNPSCNTEKGDFQLNAKF